MITSTLPPLLNQLHSDESRATFLRQLYSPGKTELADFIIANCQRQEIWGIVIDGEIKFAQEQQ